MRQRIIAIVTCGWFAVCLCLPMVQHVFHPLADVAVVENRALAPLPKHGLRASYPGQLQKYWDDHFGLRLHLNVVAGYVALAFRDPDARVIRGKQHWLYIADHLTVGVIERVDPLVAAAAERHEAFQEWLANRGIVNFVVIPRDKHNVYPEFLPDDIERVESSDIYNVLRAYVRDHELALNLVDIGDVLIAEKARNPMPLYWESDTHWNGLGSTIAAITMMDAFGDVFPAIPKHGIDEYDMRKVIMQGGDLAQMLALPMEYPMTEFVPLPRFELRARRAEPGFVTNDDPAHQPLATEVDDLYLPRALVFRDSYLNAPYWLVAQAFRRAIYVWNGGRFLEDLIERESPDMLVQEHLERDCATIDPIPAAMHDELDDLKRRRNAFAQSRRIVSQVTSRELRTILRPGPSVEDASRIAMLEISGNVPHPTVVTIDVEDGRPEKRVLYPRAGKALVTWSRWPSEAHIEHGGDVTLDITLKAVDR